MLNAFCDVRLDDPRAVLARLCNHYAEHGTAAWSGRQGRISIVYGSAALQASDGSLRMTVAARDETDLAYVKMGLVHHLREFAAPGRPAIRWSGDGSVGVIPPFFREMRVVETRDLTPAMRRVVLRGRDLARFAQGGLHVRLIFPPKGRAPVWPLLGEDGCPVWPGGEDALTARVYTVRRLDPARGEAVIDILRHDGDATPGSRFAATARPGDVVGMAGPAGEGVPAARSLVLLGDETAIPAIARILESLPAEAIARALIEVAGREEEQALPSPAATQVTWLHRNGAAPGGRLPAALEALGRDSVAPETFVWAGCEFADFKAIRRYLRVTRKMSRDAHLVVAYWRKGIAGDEARRGA